MINRFHRIQNLGLFKDFEWNKEKVNDFLKVNIIYGYNGSGKTTVSNILRLFSLDTSEADKGELLDDLITNTNEYEVSLYLNNRKKSLKPSGSGTINIRVFNSDFVTSHVYDGSISNMKSFDSSIKTNLKDEKISKLENEISEIDENLNGIRKKRDSSKESFDQIKKLHTNNFNNEISGKRLPPINLYDDYASNSLEELYETKTKLLRRYNLSLEHADFDADLSSIRELNIKDVQVNVKAAGDLLKRNVMKQSRMALKSKIKAYKKIEMDDTGISVEKWFKNGHGLLEYSRDNLKKQCPLCDSYIEDTIDGILKDFEEYFNTEYEELREKLTRGIDLLDEHIHAISDNKKVYDLLISYKKKYGLVDLELEAFDSTMIMESLKSLKSAINKKVKNVGDDFSSEFDSEILASSLAKYKIHYSDLSDFKTSVLDSLDSLELNTGKILTEIKALYKQIILCDFNTSNDGNNISEYSRSEIEIDKIESELERKKRFLAEARANLKLEARYVNDYLKKLGIHHFTIDVNQSQATENIQIIFESGVRKTRLKHSISEGEKTALAFAYFLSKIRFEVSDNQEVNLAEETIVLDDPVSSLDENRLYSTACVINSEFANVKQLFILSHNLVFLKFIGNLVGHKERSDYFLSGYKREAKIENLPRTLTNYTTIYYQKLQDVIEFNYKKIKYEEAKRHIPNDIRVVLESFLSFKFSVLNNGSSNEKTRAAGLSRLINKIERLKNILKNHNQVDDVDHDTIVSKLQNIQKITDPQAHGSPQAINEFNFISENELNLIANDTINIIQFLDNLHINNLPVSD